MMVIDRKLERASNTGGKGPGARQLSGAVQITSRSLRPGRKFFQEDPKEITREMLKRLWEEIIHSYKKDLAHELSSL